MDVFTSHDGKEKSAQWQSALHSFQLLATSQVPINEPWACDSWVEDVDVNLGTPRHDRHHLRCDELSGTQPEVTNKSWPYQLSKILALLGHTWSMTDEFPGLLFLSCSMRVCLCSASNQGFYLEFDATRPVQAMCMVFAKTTINHAGCVSNWNTIEW